MENIKYLLVDEEGYVAELRSMPEVVSADGMLVVILADGVLPTTTQLRVDPRKLPEPVNTVARLADVLLPWEPTPMPDEHRFEMERGAALADLDRRFAVRLAAAAGPLSGLHAEKRRQAEAGGGPLVVDEADRLAILENAAQQDAVIAGIERERRAIKARLRAALTAEDIKAALADTLCGDKR